MQLRSLFPRIITLLATVLVASSCQIEGGVRDRTPVVPNTTPDAILAPTNQSVADALAQRNDVWAIGITELPNDLFPYPKDSALKRANSIALEMISPSPILAYNYDYVTTGVLTRIPTIENGDVNIADVSVFLDAAGNITTTTTTVITQVQQVSITYHWNEKLTWSDGVPVTAADSVFAYELARAQAPLGEEARILLDRTADYKLIDDHTTKAVMQPDLTGNGLFFSYWTPLPKHLLADIPPAEIRDSPYAKRPVGYGPYMLESRTSNEIRFVRNPYFSGTIPAVNNVTLTQMSGVDMIRANLANGNLDVAVTDRVAVDQYAFIDQDARAGLPVTYYRSPVWEHIDFNLDVQTLQDIRIRRAIAYAFNRHSLADTLFNGRSPMLNSWILPEQSGASPEDQLKVYDYSPETANNLLDDAGYGKWVDGIRHSKQDNPLTLTLITTTGSPLRQEIAERFQADLKEVGIDVQLSYLQPEEIFSPSGPLFLRQFDLALFAWIASPDPAGLQLWSCASVPSETNGHVGNNFAGWCMRDADYAVKTAATTNDKAVQIEQYQAQQKLFTQELPSLPLFQRLGVALAAQTVEGVKPDALAPITWNIAEWKRK